MHFLKASIFIAMASGLISLISEFKFYQFFFGCFGSYIFLLGLNSILFKPLIFSFLKKKVEKTMPKIDATDKLFHKPKINVVYPKSPLRSHINN